ncbi:MAG TPA: hypothetical protein VK669_06455 [Candidatus Limnocylindrales bacterium]|nr:hypothetical protein [Candidatus Limnocylindrales bacterium]
MSTITHTRRPRTLLAALALAAFTLGTIPLASPAAPAASAKKRVAAKKSVAARKPAAKKVAGYHPRNGPAPADEYFGRLQMSVLGVRNKVKDLGLDADFHPEHDKAVLGSAIWVEDAMRDWAKKYPFDKWLPRYAYALEQMYEHIPGDEAHRRAVKQISYLTAYFPQTVYGKVGRAKLAMGVPTPDPSETPAIVETDLQRLALLDGKVTPTLPPAPTPKPSPSPEAIASPAPDATPSPAPASTASPAPATTAKP